MLNRILSFACTKGNATIVIRTPSSTLTSTPSPRSSTCIHRSDDALATSTPIAGRLKLWQSIRRPNGSRASIRWRGPIRACVWGIHERSNSTNGLSSWKKRCNGRAGIRGAECSSSICNLLSHLMLTLQQINRYVSIGALKHYFNVTTPYVLRKLLLVLFPWRHKPWSRQQRPSTTGSPESNSYSYYFLPPSDDLNSPDMYIPVMAFVTYILLSTLLAGIRGAFHPEVMGLAATAAFAIVAIEILGLKFGTYILSISNDSQLLDLVAYSGYKFVGVIVTLVVAEILNGGKGTGGWAGWTVFTYTFLANAFFLVSVPPLAHDLRLPPQHPSFPRD